MKKQIFILSMFMLAMLFAGMRVYGQPDYPLIYQTVPGNNLINCITPELFDPSCASGDQLHPSVGVDYDYEVSKALCDISMPSGPQNMRKK